MTRTGAGRLPDESRLLIDGEWVDGIRTFEIQDRFTGEPVTSAHVPSPEQIGSAVDAAREASVRERLAPYDRFRILRRASELLEGRREDLVASIVAETGFTRADGEGEVRRCVQTLLLSGEEAKRIRGEMVPIEGVPGQTHRRAFTVREPLGVVAAITPFNSPLNTVAHKVAPALAAGNAVVLKPAEQTPATATILCQVLLEAGLPSGLLSLLHGPGPEVGAPLTLEEGVDFVTFTGSTAVGREIQHNAGLRPTSMELGNISATVICRDAPLEWAAPRVVRASFRKAGQVCTSVQRLYVQEQVMDAFLEKLVVETAGAKVGDPWDPETLLGPMISEEEAVRAEEWIREALEGGARLVRGGKREGATLQPTILRNPDPRARVMCEEIFAPVLSVVPYRHFDDAVDAVNGTPYGLAAGVFTRSLERAYEAARRLRMGGVHVNETSSARVDIMPYGGVKASGFGREGPRYAIDEMTEERLVTISLPSEARENG